MTAENTVSFREGPTLELFKRRRRKPVAAMVGIQERAALFRRLVEKALSERLELNEKSARRTLSSERNKYRMKERQAKEAIKHEMNECLIRTTLEKEEQALKAEIANIKNKTQAARVEAAKGLYKLDARLRELAQAQVQ